ncbi:MAG: 2-oxoacid:acceptor oxidoreductase subunit alpha [Chloroflexi bacterium]|nr:2-oxoacid:acceptor oxidoreductase subunit alpha [Chloroflexota bacterium]
MPVEANFMVGGEAGQGVQSVGAVLAKTLARGGYHVFADQDYESRIRGGHNFFRIRASNMPVAAIKEPLDILVALNQETIDLHRMEVAPGGVVVYDQEKGQPGEGNYLGVPFTRLAQEKAGNRIMANSVAFGAALGLTGYDLDAAANIVRGFFGGDVGEANVTATRAGYDYATENFKGERPLNLKPLGDGKRLLMNGHDAVALGAIAAGCNFMAGYPMTPATPILEYLSTHAKDMDMAVVQTEDEISAINMAIGASFAGARAMTATSGSGFCLMVEGVGLAGITETPVVIVNAQRPGPAVGLPTRTEQGDLLFVLHCHQGDFPRAVLAPASVEDAFWLTIKAFNLADKYQLPVIMLTDHYLATSYITVDGFDLSKVVIDRGETYSPERHGPPQEYKRHKVTGSGISPRAFPGLTEALVVTDSDEHDETGHLIEDARARTEQVEKRLRKLNGLGQETSPPEVYGPPNAETTLVGWGSTWGALRESIDILNRGNGKFNLLHLRELWPFPSEAVNSILQQAKRSYVVESNAAGQLARLIRAETGRLVDGKVLKYDGRPFTPSGIAEQVKEEVYHGAKS